MNIMFETVTNDLLMVSVVYNDHIGTPCYWRLTGMNGIPPLEVGIDYKKGFIQSVTFFVDGFKVKRRECVNCLQLEGDILVDTSIFTKASDYVDINQIYDVYYNDNQLMCFFKDKNEIVSVVINDRVGFLVDCDYHIMGFFINNLSENEKK